MQNGADIQQVYKELTDQALVMEAGRSLFMISFVLRFLLKSLCTISLNLHKNVMGRCFFFFFGQEKGVYDGQIPHLSSKYGIHLGAICATKGKMSYNRSEFDPNAISRLYEPINFCAILFHRTALMILLCLV